MSLTRLLFVLAAAIAIVALGVSVAILTQAQSASREVTVPEPPSCAEAIQLYGLEGIEVHCEEPLQTIDTGEPVMHGAYRLVEPGFRGDLTYQYAGPDEPTQGVVCGPGECNVEDIRASAIFKAPTFVPEGYDLLSIDTVGVSSASTIRSTYAGPGQAIEVWRIRRFEQPVDVYVSSPDSWLETLLIDVGTVPAVAYRPAPSSPIRDKQALQLSFIQGHIETVVRGYGLDIETATRIAESMLEAPP